MDLVTRIGRMPSATVMLWALLMPGVTAAKAPNPVIDMHMHAMAAHEQGPPPVAMCVPIHPMPAWDAGVNAYGETFMRMLKEPHCQNPVWSPLTDDLLMSATVQVMNELNIYGVLSGSPAMVANWQKAAPGRFFSGINFRLNSPGRDYAPEQIMALRDAGQLDVLAEITNQYAGIPVNDPRMEPYWSLAETLDIPVGVHMGPGPPGIIYLGASHYRASLSNPLQLEDVLARHPQLRLYIMHAGFPFLDALLAVMYAHPQVYVDTGVIIFSQSEETFSRYLRRIVENGFANRVMFGSDQMVWPGVIPQALDRINKADFLRPNQKRDILYNNAARFLRLSEKQIAKHHEH